MTRPRSTMWSSGAHLLLLSDRGDVVDVRVERVRAGPVAGQILAEPSSGQSRCGGRSPRSTNHVCVGYVLPDRRSHTGEEFQ